jgi:hypothetical protein
VTTKYFNVKNGMTTGNILVSDANVTLGNVSNLHISGGNSGYFLSTNGNGSLSWQDAASSVPVDPMPTIVDDGETMTIRSNYQGLYGTPITVDGTIVIDGALVDVSGQGAAGSNSQIQFNDLGNPAGNNGFTFNKVSGNMNVPGSISVGAFFTFPAYSKAELGAITGVLGQLAVLNDSNPIGQLVFWDASNNRWAYVGDNAAITTR